MLVTRSIVLASLLVAAMPAGGGAAPTPVPGGANAVSAVSAKAGETVFNGVLRIKIVALREATPEDGNDLTPSADQKVMVMQSLLHNGTRDTFTDLLRYTVADADAVSVEIPSSAIKHANPHILQGAALKQSAFFLVDKDFSPTKLIVECASCSTNEGFRPVRFALATK